jgi:hypothetical protein
VAEDLLDQSQVRRGRRQRPERQAIAETDAEDRET